MFLKLTLRKIGQGHPRVIILSNYDGLESQMLHTKFREFLSGFYHILAWRPSWSCDPDFVIKLLFFISMDAPHKISV